MVNENSTNDVVKVKVGGHQYNAAVAIIDKGGKWALQVDVNATYRELTEFQLQDASGTNVVIVSSDDCCDSKCITIKEAAPVGGENTSVVIPVINGVTNLFTNVVINVVTNVVTNVVVTYVLRRLLRQ